MFLIALSRRIRIAASFHPAHDKGKWDVDTTVLVRRAGLLTQSEAEAHVRDLVRVATHIHGELRTANAARTGIVL